MSKEAPRGFFSRCFEGRQFLVYCDWSIDCKIFCLDFSTNWAMQAVLAAPTAAKFKVQSSPAGLTKTLTPSGRDVILSRGRNLAIFRGITMGLRRLGFLVYVCAPLAALLPSAVAHAAFTTAYDVQSIGVTYGFNGTSGYEFTPLKNIVLKQLGFFDFGQNGLTNAPPIGWPLVGLWQTDGTPILQTAVTSSDPLQGYYRFATVPDTLLSAGTTYVIGGRTESDPLTDTRFSTISSSPDISFGNARFHPSSNLNFPTGSAPGFIYLAPNFTYVSAVPEPAMLLVLPAVLCVVPFGVWLTKSLGVREQLS